MSIAVIISIIGSLASAAGVVWRIFRKKGEAHETVEAAVDAARYDELDRFDRL